MEDRTNKKTVPELLKHFFQFQYKLGTNSAQCFSLSAFLDLFLSRNCSTFFIFLNSEKTIPTFPLKKNCSNT